jgi:hypothetical protein
MIAHMSLAEAARSLGVPQYRLLYVIDASGLKPSVIVPDNGSIWSRSAGYGFSEHDVDVFRDELYRRQFKGLRSQFRDMIAGDAELAMGPGWTDILADFLSRIGVHAGERKAVLVYAKEKFGNIQIGFSCDEALDEIVAAEESELRRQSLATCEECGSRGRLRLGKSMCKTTCDLHVRLVGELRPEDGMYLDVEDWVRANRKDAENEGRVTDP